MINYEFEQFHKKFFDMWHSDAQVFSFQTSGSTGPKAQIFLTRDQLTYSAKTTLEFIDPDQSIKSSLLCINPHFIGGAMVMVRALIGNHTLTLINPTTQLNEILQHQEFDLVSLVPLQIQALLERDPALIFKFKKIIVGGAPLEQNWIDLIRESGHPACYHSYGMTETASHIALKRLGFEDFYTLLGDIEIITSARNTAQIRGSVTKHQWIETNDIIELLDSSRFIWRGRADHVINSGGLKIIPEEIELLLQSQISHPFLIIGTPHEKYGTIVSLLIETKEPLDLNSFDFTAIPNYARPKLLLTLPSFAYTETHKIKRGETIKLLNL